MLTKEERKYIIECFSANNTYLEWTIKFIEEYLLLSPSLSSKKEKATNNLKGQIEANKSVINYFEATFS